jgi:mannose-6-phosphate isomerase
MSAPLHFTPILKERVWGGAKLSSYLRESIPDTSVIGEAWLISDHPSAESVVDNGPHRGQTLRELLTEDADAILGRLASLTPHGRFPLLLKILDAGTPLSVQVHPDDSCAKRLAEPDVGKTEMWHVIQADAGSELVCGLDPAVDAAGFRTAVERGGIEDAMTRFETVPGDSVFVSAGTVHAIGGGILLAEIQQNSDLTYRIYDYDRPGPDGNLRELHLDKAAEAIHFSSSHGGKNGALELPDQNAVSRSMLAACRYFAAERWTLNGPYTHDTRGDSFHVVLSINESATVTTEGGESQLSEGQAVLVPGDADEYTIEGHGTALVYYVPDLVRDIVEPLQTAGHGTEAIIRLCGDPSTSDLTGLVD